MTITRCLVACLCAAAAAAVDVTLPLYGTCDATLLTASQQTAAAAARADVFHTLFYGSVVLSVPDAGASAYQDWPIYRAQIVPVMAGAAITGYQIASVSTAVMSSSGVQTSSIISYDVAHRPTLGAAIPTATLQAYIIVGSQVNWYTLPAGMDFQSDLAAGSFRWVRNTLVDVGVDTGGLVTVAGAATVPTTPPTTTAPLANYPGAYVQLRNTTSGVYTYVLQKDIILDNPALYDPVRYNGQLITGGGFQSSADPTAFSASYTLDGVACIGHFAATAGVAATALPGPLASQAAASELPPPVVTTDPIVDSSSNRGAMPVITETGPTADNVQFYTADAGKAQSTATFHDDVTAVSAQAQDAGNAQDGLMAAIGTSKPNPSSGAIHTGVLALGYGNDPLTGLPITETVDGNLLATNGDTFQNNQVLVRYDDQGQPIDPQTKPVVTDPPAAGLGADLFAAVDTAHAAMAPHMDGGTTWAKPVRHFHHGSAIYPIDLYDAEQITRLGTARRVPVKRVISAAADHGFQLGIVNLGDRIDISYDSGTWNVTPSDGTGVPLKSPDGDGVPLAIMTSDTTTSAPVPADLLTAYPWLSQVHGVVAWVPRATRNQAWSFIFPSALGSAWLACPDAGNYNDNPGSATYWVTWGTSSALPPRTWADRTGDPSPGDGDNPADPRPVGTETLCGRPFYDFDDDGDLDRWYTDDPFDGGYKRLHLQWRIEDGNKQLSDFSYSLGNHIVVSALKKPKKDPSTGQWVVTEDLMFSYCHNHKPFHHRTFSLFHGYKTYYSASHFTLLDPLSSSDRTLYQFAVKNYAVTDTSETADTGVDPSDMIPSIQTVSTTTPKDLNGDGTIDANEYWVTQSTLTTYPGLATFYDATDPSVHWQWSSAVTLPTGLTLAANTPAIFVQTVQKPDGTIISTTQASIPVEVDATTGASAAFSPALVPVNTGSNSGTLTAKSDGYQYDYPHDKSTAQGGSVPCDPQHWVLPWNINPSSQTDHCTKSFSLNSANLDYFDPIWKTKQPVITHQGLLNDELLNGTAPRVQWLVREIANTDPLATQTLQQWRDGQVLYTDPAWVPGLEWLMPGRAMLHVFGWDSRTDMTSASHGVGDISMKNGSRYYEIISGLGEYYFRGTKYRPVTVDEQKALLVRMWNYYFTGYEHPDVSSTGAFAILPSLAIPQRYNNEDITSKPLNQAVIAITTDPAVTSNTSDSSHAGDLGGRVIGDLANPNGDPDSAVRAAVDRRTRLMREQVYVFSAARGREWELEMARRMPPSVRLECVEWEDQDAVKAALPDRDLRFPDVRSTVTTDANGVTSTQTTSAEVEVLRELSKDWLDGPITKMGFANGGFGYKPNYDENSAQNLIGRVQSSPDGFVKHLPEGLPAGRAAYAYELRSFPISTSRQWTVDDGQEAHQDYVVEFRHPMLFVYHDRASMLYVHYGRNCDPDQVFGAWDKCAPQLAPIDADSAEFRRRVRFESWATVDHLDMIYSQLFPDGYASWLATRGSGPTPPADPGAEPQVPTAPAEPSAAKPISPPSTMLRNWDVFNSTPSYTTMSYTDPEPAALDGYVWPWAPWNGFPGYIGLTPLAQFNQYVAGLTKFDMTKYGWLRKVTWTGYNYTQGGSLLNPPVVVTAISLWLDQGQSFTATVASSTTPNLLTPPNISPSDFWPMGSHNGKKYEADLYGTTAPEHWPTLPSNGGGWTYNSLTQLDCRIGNWGNAIYWYDVDTGALTNQFHNSGGGFADTKFPKGNFHVLLHSENLIDGSYDGAPIFPVSYGYVQHKFSPLTNNAITIHRPWTYYAHPMTVAYYNAVVDSNLKTQDNWYQAIYTERAQDLATFETNKQLYNQYLTALATWNGLWNSYSSAYASYLQQLAAYQVAHAQWAVKKAAYDAWVLQNQSWLQAKAIGDQWQTDRDAWVSLVQAEINPAGVSWTGDTAVTLSALADIQAIQPQIPIWEAYEWFIDPTHGVPEGAL